MPSHYPLEWPDGLPRSAARVKSTFRVRLQQAVTDLEDALRLFGQDTGRRVSAVVISSNVTLGCERPSDPGIAVWFEWDFGQRCIAVDRYQTPVENLRAIYHILEARRSEMRHGGLAIVRASFKGFLALPPAESWRDVLGVGPEADLDAVEHAFRTMARSAHPDMPGGSHEAMARLNKAMAEARRQFGRAA